MARIAPLLLAMLLAACAENRAPASTNPAIEAATPEAAEVTRTSDVVHLDFEVGSFAGWSTKRLVAAYSADVETQRVRTGRYAARFELRHGDRVSEGWRAELRDPYNALYDRDTWYGFSTYLPLDYPEDHDYSCVLAQWHDQAAVGEGSGKPPIAHRIKAGRFYVTTEASPTATTNPLDKGVPYETMRAIKGVWHDFVYRVRWSRSDDAEIEMWKDGERIFGYRGPLGYADETKGPYFKFGMYCGEDVRQPHVVYHDNYGRGLSYQDVDPSLTRVP